MNIVRYSRIIASKEDNKILLDQLDILKEDYPKIKKWFYNKVLSKLGKKRDIIFLKENDSIVGVVIVKIKKNVIKLSTFKILEEYQGNEYGLELLKLLDKEFNPIKGFYVYFKEKHQYKFLSLFRKFCDINNYELVEINDCKGENGLRVIKK